MELYWIRHGIAVDRMDLSVKSDEERWLTEDGIKKMERASHGFHSLIPSLDVIFTSPFVRARQTADIIARTFGDVGLVQVLDDLMPGANFDGIQTAIKNQPSNARIAFVGHEPDFSELIAILTTGSPRPEIEMKKGSICRIDMKGKFLPGTGVLVWLLPSKILRKKAF